MSNTGRRLAELRGEISQKAFAESLGLSQSNYWNYENGRSRPTDELIVRVCSNYHCSAEWLLGLSEEREPATVQSLSPREQRLFKLFRGCSELRQERVFEFVTDQAALSDVEADDGRGCIEAACD